MTTTINYGEKEERDDRMSNEESARLNSMDSMIEDSTTNKGDKPGKVEDVNKLQPKVSNEKKLSLAQAEKNIISFIEKTISENTATICGLIFRDEISAEFERQISELKNDSQEKNSKILEKMKDVFFDVENGKSFVEFKTNVANLRSKCLEDYKVAFEAEKIKKEQRKAIETQISALEAVRAVIGEEAYTVGVNSLREKLAAI